MTDEELENKATDWIRSQGWSEENLPSDEYLQMRTAYVAGAKENGVVWHDLQKDPNDLPKFEGDYMCALLNSNYSFILSFAMEDGLKYWQDNEDTDWTDEVIAWGEIPKFEESE